MFNESQLLPISGLQHFVFCKRQCALIHIERQWQENLATAQGRILHAKAHKPGSNRRINIQTYRSLEVHSLRLGLFGQMDLLVKDNSDSQNPVYIPQEYKRGRPKKNPCDRVQLCAQTICLEEMLFGNKNSTIPYGEIFYGKTKRRMKVEFTNDLRQMTERYTSDFHAMIFAQKTPAPESGPKCAECSLKEKCLPDLSDSFSSVNDYIENFWASFLESK